MAFIRKRISPSKQQTPSYQVIETYREDGRVKQRILANLGRYPTLEDALAEFRKEMAKTRRLIEGANGGSSENPTSLTVRRRLERWRRSFERQQEAVQKLETLMSSGKTFGPSDSTPAPDQSSSANFLDWVLERNSNGWV